MLTRALFQFPSLRGALAVGTTGVHPCVCLAEALPLVAFHFVFSACTARLCTSSYAFRGLQAFLFLCRSRPPRLLQLSWIQVMALAPGTCTLTCCSLAVLEASFLTGFLLRARATSAPFLFPLAFCPANGACIARRCAGTAGLSLAALLHPSRLPWSLLVPAF